MEKVKMYLYICSRVISRRRFQDKKNHPGISCRLCTCHCFLTEEGGGGLGGTGYP